VIIFDENQLQWALSGRQTIWGTTGGEVDNDALFGGVMFEVCGALPWRTSLGSAIHLARHHNNDAVAELVRVYARDTLKKWLPNITVTGIEVRQESATLFLNVRYRGPNARDSSVEVYFT
jgi:hypothetical protein